MLVGLLLQAGATSRPAAQIAAGSPPTTGQPPASPAPVAPAVPPGAAAPPTVPAAQPVPVAAVTGPFKIADQGVLRLRPGVTEGRFDISATGLKAIADTTLEQQLSRAKLLEVTDRGPVIQGGAPVDVKFSGCRSPKHRQVSYMAIELEAEWRHTNRH